MTPPADASIRAFEIQAAVCDAMGSPFSGALLAAAARDVAAGGPTAGLVAPWAGLAVRDLIRDAVALRWLGGLHDLALSGEAPGLAAAYPGGSGEASVAWEAALGVMRDRPARLAAFMAHEPQTNEVRRSACLLPGFLQVAAATGLPLRIFELGASAGLNQLWDRRRYRLGAAGAWGDPAAGVVIDTDWRGPAPPLDAPVRVIERAACDRAPVDLADPIARRRLRAYVWADQPDRLARLDGAVRLARDAGVAVEAEDAAIWTARRVAPTAGAASVLFHSVVWQYMTAPTQARLAATLLALGEAARPEAPFAWLRMEPPPADMATMELRLTLWPGGLDRRLAVVHPHGAWVEWTG